MTISPSQAAKLRELVIKARKAQDWCHGASEFGTPQQHQDAMQQMFAAENELDAYITSLTGESK